MFGKKWKVFGIALVLVMLAGSLAGCGSVKSNGQGEASGKYYEGKTITLIVPNQPGKGMDNVARLIAPYIEKYSGAKNIIVKNIVGAGGVMGVNELWNSKPDGLTFTLTSVPTVILSQLSGGEGVQYDPTKFTYLGRASTEPRLLAVGGTSKINNMDDIVNLGRPFVFPTQGTDEDFFTMAILADSLGFQLKAVTGFEGNADTAFAVVKGDGDGHITAVSDAATMIKEGDKKPILIVGSERSEEYPDIPTALEVVKDEKAKQSVQAIINMIDMHRSFFGPANMDEEATKAMREAIWQALNDKELQEKALKLNNPISPLQGEEEQQKVEEIAKAAQSIVPILKEAIASVK